jgi:hypothetical protein
VVGPVSNLALFGAIPNTFTLGATLESLFLALTAFEALS